MSFYILLAVGLGTWGFSYTSAYSWCKTKCFTILLNYILHRFGLSHLPSEFTSKITASLLSNEQQDLTSAFPLLSGLMDSKKEYLAPEEATIKGSVMEIPYRFRGEKYIIHVRYNRRLLNGVTFVAKDKEGNTYALDYHPFIHPTLSVQDLGFSKIKVLHSNLYRKKYTGVEVPLIPQPSDVM